MRLILSSSEISRCSTLDTSVLDTQDDDDDALLETTPVTVTGTGSLSVEAVVAMVTAASGALLVASTMTDRRLDVAVGALDGITVAATDGIIVDWTIVATCTPLTPIVTITVRKATHDNCTTMDCTTME